MGLIQKHIAMYSSDLMDLYSTGLSLKKTAPKHQEHSKEATAMEA
jgi:hypothetical protein